MKPKQSFHLNSLKKIDKTHLMIAALAGILLLVIAIPTENKKKEKLPADGADGSTAAGVRSAEGAYRRSLERQLESMLSAMDGVGSVRVMITLKDDGEAVVEKDWTKNEELTNEEDGKGTKRENRVADTKGETVYEKGSSYENVPFVSKELKPAVEGVFVVAEGAKVR